MTDPLSLLRHYHSNQLEIKDGGDKFFFGEVSWPKNVKTNYVVYNTGKDGKEKEFYTLECLVFFIRNLQHNHSLYIKYAVEKKRQMVTRADRKELLLYLTGKIATSANIDKTAFLELASPSKKRTAEESLYSTPKKLRIVEGEDLQTVKNQLAARLEAHRDAVFLHNINKSLSETMTQDKIAEIKTKALAKKRTTIKGIDFTELKSAKIPKVDFDLVETKQILATERFGRDRNTILQASSKTFDVNVFGILSALEAQENGQNRPRAPSPPPLTIPKPRVRPPVQYDRYDQAEFAKEETEGFQINLLGTYHGKMLKEVMPKEPQPLKKNPPVMEQNVQVTATVNETKKRVSQTPIIIVPSVHSLVTMLNAKDILEDLDFVTVEEKKARGGTCKRDTNMLIQRQKFGVTVPYRVTDSPTKLTDDEWQRVVGVFVMGPAWQFKGWPWNGNPVEIFSRVCAFHLKYDEQKLDVNVNNWAVTVIPLSRTRRHLDKAALMTFWNKLDESIAKTKPYLRY